MKKFFLMATIMLSFGAVSAQIAEVKQDGNIAKIYNDQGRYTNSYISLCSKCELTGYNSKYIVITDGNIAKIYNDQGRYTNSYISLCSNCYVKNVSATAILVKDGNITKYYDFNGRYTNKYTSN
jgi:hypothetical protein